VRVLRGALLADRGHVEQALTFLEESLKKRADPRLYALRGAVLSEAGRADEAVSALLRAIQAKGRVERMNGTLQDRLVKEMRLAGINEMASANQFLVGKYLRAFHRQFARAAAQPLDAHRKNTHPLPEVLSWETERVVQGDWTVACEGKRYQLDSQHEALSLVRRKVIVRTQRNGRVQLVYRDQRLKWRALPAGSVRKPKPEKPAKAAGKVKPKRAGKTPAKHHPWRRDGVGLGRKFWNGIKGQGRAVRLAERDSGRHVGKVLSVEQRHDHQ
jgi:hypothetical protein